MTARLFFVLLSGALSVVGCNAATAETETVPEAPVLVGGEVVAQADDQAEPAGEPESQPAAEPESQPATGHDHGSAERPGPIEPGETGHYGAPFASEGEPLALSAAIETCAGSAEACKVAGTIDRVCQNSGCWFTLADPAVESTVRIRMLDYGFFVPRNAAGAAVVLEGTLAAQEVSVETLQHYADDEAAAGGERRVITEPEMNYEFTITGAEITAVAAAE